MQRGCQSKADSHQGGDFGSGNSIFSLTYSLFLLLSDDISDDNLLVQQNKTRALPAPVPPTRTPLPVNSPGRSPRQCKLPSPVQSLKVSESMTWAIHSYLLS